MKTIAPEKVRAWLRHLHHSLRWRLLVLFLLLAMALSAAFIGGTKKTFSMGWRDAVKPLLTDYVDRLALEVGSPPDVQKARLLVERLPISIRIEGPTAQFDSHPERREVARQRDARSHASDDASQNLLKRTTFDGHTISFGLGNMEWRHGPGVFGWFTLALLLALTAVAFAYVRRLFKPLDDISAGVQRFAVGQFNQPIVVARADELGDLAGQINVMGQEIAQMLDAKRALLLAISHELRSPLTRARLNTELLPDAEDTQETRGALLRDLAEMAQLITDLLETERLSGNHAALNLEPTDLGELVREMAGNMKGTVLLTVNIDANLPLMQLDRTRIKLLLRNLLDNAQSYGHDGYDGDAVKQPIEIIVGCAGERLALTLRDHGPGISADQLPKLGQAFFRPDASRQRSTGGVGLGLYLCRLVAQAHGGSLTLDNANPGLRATVSFPLTKGLR